MSDEQLWVLTERIKDLLDNAKSKERANVSVITNKSETPVRILYSTKDKPESKIECCVHCGSIAIKKHGTTKGGVQRYICKDCNKSFSENYGLITYYTHLDKWKWQEIIRCIISRESLTKTAKSINTSVKTAWLCRMKIYHALMDIYGYCDEFNSIVEADGKYERVSFKGTGAN